MKIISKNWVIKKHNIVVTINPLINESNFGFIYLFENKIDNKKYVGQTINYKRRIKEHLSLYDNKKNLHLYNALKRYGFNNFNIEIIDDAKSLYELNEKEKYYIEKYESNNRDYDYNIDVGGNNYTRSVETCKKISKIKKEKGPSEKQKSAYFKKTYKFDILINKIIDEFESACDASRKLGVSDATICRYAKNNKIVDNILWTYESDLERIKLIIENKKNEIKNVYCDIRSFSNEKLNEIYGDHNLKMSYEDISRKYNLSVSSIKTLINNKSLENNPFEITKDIVAVCKKTGITIGDAQNNSGKITAHMYEHYSKDIIPSSKFLRNKFKVENNGKVWYYDYFDFKKEETSYTPQLMVTKPKLTPEQAQRHLEKTAKPLIKVDVSKGIILEEHISLAKAGNDNSDGFTYDKLAGLCNGKTKQEGNVIWCYKKDYENNTIPEYKKDPIEYKKLEEFSEKELNNMYLEYKNGKTLRDISRDCKIVFSTIQKYIQKKESVKDKQYEITNNMIAICKKTNKTFRDAINSSGALTIHVKEEYPNDTIPETLYLKSKYKIENNGKVWYYDYFDFKKIS